MELGFEQLAYTVKEDGESVEICVSLLGDSTQTKLSQPLGVRVSDGGGNASGR